MRRTDPSDPFAVVLQTSGVADPVVLRSARDAEGATAAFHAERQRLKQRQVIGDLLLVRHGEDARTLLRGPLP